MGLVENTERRAMRAGNWRPLATYGDTVREKNTATPVTLLCACLLQGTLCYRARVSTPTPKPVHLFFLHY